MSINWHEFQIKMTNDTKFANMFKFKSSIFQKKKTRSIIIRIDGNFFCQVK